MSENSKKKVHFIKILLCIRWATYYFLPITWKGQVLSLGIQRTRQIIYELSRESYRLIKEDGAATESQQYISKKEPNYKLSVSFLSFQHLEWRTSVQHFSSKISTTICFPLKYKLIQMYLNLIISEVHIHKKELPSIFSHNLKLK